MPNPFRKRATAISVGIGAGLAGAAVLVLRYAFRPIPRVPIPDSISPAIFATRVARSSLGQFVYHESGTGAPIIFLHGINIGASSYEWSKVYPEFATNYRVLAPDLLGFGESERASVQLTAEDHARSLAEFIQITCERRRPIIVASNISAGFCVLLASHHPDLIERLILLMPTGLTEFGKRRVPLWLSLTPRLPAIARPIYRKALATRQAITSWLQKDGFRDPSKVQEEHIALHHTCANQSGAHYSIFALLRDRYHFEFQERFASLAVPVSLLWSDSCEAAPLEWAYRLMSGAPRNTTLTVIKNASLLAALEEPGQTIEAIAGQLEPALRVLSPA
jgi:haloalkane dehalogenase